MFTLRLRLRLDLGHWSERNYRKFYDGGVSCDSTQSKRSRSRHLGPDPDLVSELRRDRVHNSPVCDGAFESQHLQSRRLDLGLSHRSERNYHKIYDGDVFCDSTQSQHSQSRRLDPLFGHSY
jgi:hypothetical protein